MNSNLPSAVFYHTRWPLPIRRSVEISIRPISFITTFVTEQNKILHYFKIMALFATVYVQLNTITGSTNWNSYCTSSVESMVHFCIFDYFIKLNIFYFINILINIFDFIKYTSYNKNRDCNF